jgi:octaprenyl-diphosphate synthase
VLAAVMEMIHMATLVHDDVLDEARVRRRGATINHLRGNEAAVMLGDYLISHAYHLCSGLGDADLARRVADATNTVCEGELLQLANRNNWQLDERTYFEIIRRKTASLCGACCALSATMHGADAATAERLGAYGQKLGIAFQIVDDLLDLVGAEQTVGKSLGRDLAKGKLTLPLIRHLQTLTPAQQRRRVQRFDIWAQGGSDDGQDAQELEALRREVVQGDAIDYAKTRAMELAASAKQAALALPDSDARACLLDLADKVVDRQS